MAAVVADQSGDWGHEDAVIVTVVVDVVNESSGAAVGVSESRL